MIKNIFCFFILGLSINTALAQNENFEAFESDTAIIHGYTYILTVYKNKMTGNSYFDVSKNGKKILKENDYWTNNSYIYFKDANNDGFVDIVWEKKWDEHAYLFNPQIQNFVEVGECHDVDTLRVNDKIVYYQNKYPLLYFVAYDKPLGYAYEMHSELFVINKNYPKISFATLDNCETYNNSVSDSVSEIFNCYVPPYRGMYGEYSVWNVGKTIDSSEVKIDEVNNRCDLESGINEGALPNPNPFITKYWQHHFQSLLQYGQIFHVRRTKPLQYFK